MQINYAEWVCPKCGTKNREACNTWMYGSPIRHCKACHSEHLDNRFREVAIDGFDPKSSNYQLFAKGALFFFGLALICGILLFLLCSQGFYCTKIIAMGTLSALAGIACSVLSLRIKLGFTTRDNDKYMAESLARLQDPKYVEKLKIYGYKV